MAGEVAAPASARRRMELLVPAHDGTPLAVSVWLPEAAQHAPVAAFVRLTRYPPGPIDDAQDDALRGSGFAVVVARERGTGGSGGERQLPWSPAIDEDAGAVIDWIEPTLVERPGRGV